MNCQQGSAGVPLAAYLPVPNNPQHALAGKPPVVSQKALLKSPLRAGEREGPPDRASLAPIQPRLSRRLRLVTIIAGRA